MLKWIRKYGALLLVLGGGVTCVPDVVGLKTALFAISVVCLIAGSLALVIGVVDRWGIIPDFEFGRTVRRATSSPIACSITIAGFLVFLGLVVIGIFKAA